MRIPGLSWIERWALAGRRARSRARKREEARLLRHAQRVAGRKAVADHLLDLGRRGDRVIHDCGDHRLAVDSSDQFIGTHILRFGHWQRQDFDTALDVLDRHGRLEAGGVFLDVGANIGTHAIYALLSGRFVRAVAIEPEPDRFDLLRINAFLNDLGAQMTLANCAAGHCTEERLLTRDAFNKGAHSLVLDGPDRVAVPVRRIDDILIEAGIGTREVSLAWIDVEGFEPQAVAGMPSLTDRQVPLAIELNRDKYGQAAFAAFVDTLSRRYGRFVDLRADPATVRPTPRLADITERTDVLVF